MATFRSVVYDIWTILRQNFDDDQITLNHVLYWTTIYADRLRVQHDLKHPSGVSLSVFNAIPVLTDATTGRKYIILPASIYDYDNDGGIEYLSYTYMVDTNAFTQNTFSWTTAGAAKRLYWTDDERPTPDNPAIYRVGDKVFILGIECIDVNFLEAGLKTTLSYSACDLDEEFSFPPELLPILQRQILDLGRFVLQIPADRTNEGDYSLKGEDMPKTKIVSVQDMAVQQPQQQQEVQ